MLAPFPLPSSHTLLPLPDGDEEAGSGVPPDMETAVTHTAHTGRVEHRPNVAITFPEGHIGSVQFPPHCNSWTLILFLKKNAKDVDCWKQPIHVLGTPSSLQISDNENSATTPAIRSRAFIVLFGNFSILATGFQHHLCNCFV